MGLIIKWDCTYSCNLNCKHCINGDFLNDTKEELDVTSFEKIIEDIENTYKIDYLHMLGGEPTTRKDFFETWFPCPLDIKNDTVISECSFYLDQIYKKTFSCIKPIKEYIRFLHNDDNSITAISTKNLNVLKLNTLSFGILENIISRNITEYNSFKKFLKNNKIDIACGVKFLEHLKERGFILYE